MLGTMMIRKKEEDMTDMQRRLNVFLREQNARLDEEFEEARAAEDWARASTIVLSMAEITDIERQVGITKRVKYYEWIDEVVRNAKAANPECQTEESKPQKAFPWKKRWK
ncbi:MAG: hypothetical protein K2G28_09945 [Acetatifactor sp.]|nr:hypothetical protein [Acetatifactor sp.]MDE7352785.1 hypothetical protein [Acetatifactor sp.]